MNSQIANSKLLINQKFQKSETEFYPEAPTGHHSGMRRLCHPCSVIACHLSKLSITLLDTFSWIKDLENLFLARVFVLYGNMVI